MKNYSRGDVEAGFEALNNIINKSEGQRNFSIQDNSCFDSDVPFGSGTQTHLKITNNNHDINQLQNSFSSCRVIYQNEQITVSSSCDSKSYKNLKMIFFNKWNNETAF